MSDNTDDLIDSRDVIDRIAELESEAVSRYANGREDLSYGELADLDHAAHLDDWDADEYRALVALEAEAIGYAADWTHGETLIRDSYFVTYAQELAEDIGALPEGNNWPAYCIDWEWAARELRMDYSSVDFDGVTYWVR